MAVDPRSWIYGILDNIPGIIAAPARRIADRIFSIFDDAVEFAVWLKSGFAHLWQRGSWALFYIRSFAAEAVTTAQWLITIRIPAIIANAASTLRQWAVTTINTAVNAVKATLSTLDKWAKSAIAAATNKLNEARDWLLSKINAITSRLSATVDKWYDRLTNPVKFAEWIVGALIGALWRYVYANREKIVRWFLRSSPSFTEWLARELDTLLRKIL